MLFIEWHLALHGVCAGRIHFCDCHGVPEADGPVIWQGDSCGAGKGSHLIETIYGIGRSSRWRWKAAAARVGSRVADAAAARHAWASWRTIPETLSLPFQRLIYAGLVCVGAYMVLANAGVPSFDHTRRVGCLCDAVRSACPAPGQDRGAAAGPRRGTRRHHQWTGRERYARRDATQWLAPADQGRGVVQGRAVSLLAGRALCPRGVSFTVPAGTMLGIMGRSGSGKTTVTRLLQCLNASYEGMIKIDGMDLREIDLMHLRTHIGVVPQENFLFSGTIRENIAMAEPDASFADVVRAAQLSGAEEFIERLPRGYDTEIQEGGTQSFRRPAPAPGACARPAHRPAGADSRRGHQRARCGERGDRQRQSEAHGKGRTVIPFHTGYRCWWNATRSWCSSRQGLRHRHPRGTAAALRYLQAHVVPAEPSS